MATVYKPFENEQNQPQATSPSGQPLQTIATAAPASSQPQAPNQQRQGSGRFTNIQQYINANKGAGSNIAQDIRKKGDEYLEGIRKGVESAQNVTQNIQNERNRVAQAGQYAEQIQQNPIAVAQNNINDVTKLRTGQSSVGALQNQANATLQNLQQQAQPAQTFEENLKSEGGRYNILQQLYGGNYRPNYNVGQKRLDQLLFQASPDNNLGALQKDIGNVTQAGAQQISNLSGNLQGQLGTLGKDVKTAQETINNVIGGFGADQGGAYGQLYSDLTNAQQQRNEYLDNILNQAKAQFASGTISPEVAKALGINNNVNITDLDLNQFLNSIQRGDNNVSQADVITEDQQNRLDALKQLSGGPDINLGEKYGNDLNFDTQNFLDKAQQSSQSYLNRFQDQKLKDIFGQLGKDYKTLDSFKEGVNPQDLTLNQFLNTIRYGDPNSSYLLPALYMDAYYQPNNRLGDISTYNSDNLRQLSNYGNYNDIQQFLRDAANLQDQQKARTLKIGDVPSDLETGGGFNVQ